MKIPVNYRLILASASPRRREILRQAQYEFEAIDPGEVENAIATAPTPEALAIAKARAKARDVAAQLKPPFPAVVVGVDTLVAAGDEIVGKPLDRMDAERILERLSGTRHRVISGICLWLARREGFTEEILTADAPCQDAATTWVTMRKMSAEEIAAYAASGEADGKAGAYAVQETGDKFVEKMDGSFLNVVGFPLELFKEMLPKAERVWSLAIDD